MLKNVCLLCLTVFTVACTTEVSPYENSNEDLLEEISFRENPCKVKGKFIEEGSEAWDEFCPGVPSGKACCLHIEDKSICCLRMVRDPGPFNYYNVDENGDTTFVSADTIVTYVNVGPTSSDTITVGEDL
jgi:hypothetical protein